MGTSFQLPNKKVGARGGGPALTKSFNKDVSEYLGVLHCRTRIRFREISAGLYAPT